MRTLLRVETMIQNTTFQGKIPALNSYLHSVTIVFTGTRERCTAAEILAGTDLLGYLLCLDEKCFGFFALFCFVLFVFT